MTACRVVSCIKLRLRHGRVVAAGVCGMWDGSGNENDTSTFMYDCRCCCSTLNSTKRTALGHLGVTFQHLSRLLRLSCSEYQLSSAPFSLQLRFHQPDNLLEARRHHSTNPAREPYLHCPSLLIGPCVAERVAVREVDEVAGQRRLKLDGATQILPLPASHLPCKSMHPPYHVR